MHQSDNTPSELVLDSLFSAGERLGWTFERHKQAPRPFLEPMPQMPPLDTTPVQAEANRRKMSFRVMACVAVACVMLSSIGGFIGGFFALVFWPAAIATVALCVRNRGEAIARFETEYITLLGHKHQQNVQEWSERRAAHEVEERARIAQLPVWSPFSLPDTGTRVDVFGGTRYGWEAFLTTYGTSALATRAPVTVLDLSSRNVSNELTKLAIHKGVPVQREILPDQLGASDLTIGLGRTELLNALVETIHGGAESGDRKGRAQSSNLLYRIASSLDDPLTIGRLVDATRLILGERPSTQRLTQAEEERVIDLLGESFLDHTRQDLQFLLASLAPIETIGEQAEAGITTPDLRCYVVENHGTNVESELLTELIVQSITRATSAGHDATKTLIVVGADELARRHIERLAKACEARGVRLLLLFEHLRDTSEQVLGGGTVGFMRLGNHAEAEQAAQFIGREHTFVLSQFTKTVGGSQTHTDGYTESFNDTRGVSFNRSVGGPLGGQLRTVNLGSGRTTSESFSRTWGTNQSTAYSTTDSDAESWQRVHEHRVEPAVLQGLPDHALLMADPGSNGPSIIEIDCNPTIAASTSHR